MKEKGKKLPVFKIVVNDNESTGVEKVVLTNAPLFGVKFTKQNDTKRRIQG